MFVTHKGAYIVGLLALVTKPQGQQVCHRRRGELAAHVNRLAHKSLVRFKPNILHHLQPQTAHVRGVIRVQLGQRLRPFRFRPVRGAVVDQLSIRLVLEPELLGHFRRALVLRMALLSLIRPPKQAIFRLVLFKETLLLRAAFGTADPAKQGNHLVLASLKKVREAGAARRGFA